MKNVKGEKRESEYLSFKAITAGEVNKKHEPELSRQIEQRDLLAVSLLKRFCA